jgi:DNA-binding XRE family transcriptional regulator
LAGVSLPRACPAGPVTISARLARRVVGFSSMARHQAINAIENGRYDPGLPLAMKIARMFEKGLDDIFELEEND